MLVCLWFISSELCKLYRFLAFCKCLPILLVHTEYSDWLLQIQSCRLKHVESLWLLLSYMRSRMQANNGQVQLLFLYSYAARQPQFTRSHSVLVRCLTALYTSVIYALQNILEN